MPKGPRSEKRSGDVTDTARRDTKTVTAGTRDPQPKRRGFLAGQVDVPAEFDEMGAVEIERAFGVSG